MLSRISNGFIADLHNFRYGRWYALQYPTWFLLLFFIFYFLEFFGLKSLIAKFDSREVENLERVIVKS